MKSPRAVVHAVVVAGSLALLAFLVSGLVVPAMAAAPVPHVDGVLQPQTAPPKQADPNQLAWQVWQSLPADVQAKVNPRILAEFQGEVTPTHLQRGDSAALPALPRRQTRFLVYLHDQPDLHVLDTQVFASALERRNATVDLLRTSTAASQAPVRALLDDRMAGDAVTAYQPFYVANILAVEGNLMTVIELAQREDVAFIDANYPLVPLWDPAEFAAQTGPDSLSPSNWNIDLVDADRVWQELGIRGHGAVVAGFDTGVTLEHPALRDAYRGLTPTGAYDHNYNWFEPDGRLYPNGDLGASLSSQPYDCDYETHGTHTMGTMVGDGGVPGTQIGMAPAARWIAVPGICYGTMSGFRGDDIGGIKAFQWLLCPTDLSGDPASADCSKAPDVINNSWGTANPTVDLFRPIIQTLRQAGVAAVFAAGNPAAGPGSIGAPGNAPEAITVGATDQSDGVTYYSGRGPSIFPDEQKPELTAPGDYVYSSIGSGYSDYGIGSGTSMAAPHVAGLIALLVAADLEDGVRDFDVDELERFMTMTAVDLGEPGPDSDYGSGRINAFAAVNWALTAGDLTGTVRDADSGAPVAQAQITGVRGGSNDRFTTVTDTGVYSTTVPGGSYNVEVNAWGYEDATFDSQQVFAATQSVIDFRLTPLPRRTVTGMLIGAGEPVAGALVRVEESPGVRATTDADGRFTLDLPVGDHVLSVNALGYRLQRETVTVAGSDIRVDLGLTAAPRILVVHAEARFGWYMGWPVYTFFTDALTARGYTHDFWPIQYTSFEDTDTLPDGNIGYGTPSLSTLQRYDVVIWTHGGCFEGYLGCVGSMGSTAVNALLGYLDGGGKLLISGQDFAQHEDGTALLDDYVRADFVRSAAAGEGERVLGAAFLDGMELTITNAALYGYPNGGYSLSPDAVAPQDDSIFVGEDAATRAPGLSYPILTYRRGGAAALATVSCAADYRTLLYALGLDNVAPRAGEGGPEFADVLERSIEWFMSPRPRVAVQVSLDTNWTQINEGERATYTLLLANEGTEDSSVQIGLAGNNWTTRVYRDGEPVDGAVVIPPCGQVRLQVIVQPPTTVMNGETDRTTISFAGEGVTTEDLAIETLYHVSWQSEAEIPVRRWNPTVTAQADDVFLYAFGGYEADPYYPEYPDYRPTNAAARYNTCTRTWESLPPLPAPVSNAGAAVLDGKIYVVGGTTYFGTEFGFDYFQPTAQVFAYDPAVGAWSGVAPLPQPISGGAAAAFDGKIYLFGGDTWYTYLDSVHVYDPATDSWSTRNPMPMGERAYATAAVMGGKIYLVNGDFDVNVVDVYDPATDSWSETAEMNITRYGLSGAATPAGYLYVMGQRADYSGESTPAERYDPRTDTWELVSTPLYSEFRADAAYVEGRIFTISERHQSLAVASSFCTSTVRASSSLALPGAPLTFTMNVFASERDISAARVEHVLPPELGFTGFIGTPAGAAYDAATRTVSWSGPLPVGSAAIQVQYETKVGTLADFAWQTGDRFSSTTTWSAENFPTGGASVTFMETDTFTVLLPDFTASSKRVSSPQALSAVPVTYTIDIRSTNIAGDLAVMEDRLPANLTLVPGTLTASTGSADYDPATRTVTWNGEIIAPAEGLLAAADGYVWGDSQGKGALPGVEFKWQEISSTGTPVAGGDDLYICDLPIGFTFPFHGEQFERFCVSTNGFIDFGGGQSSDYMNQCPLTQPATGMARIAAVWDDLVIFDNIYIETVGESPNRTLLVQWTDVVSYYSYSFDMATFQLALHENGAIDLYVLRHGGLDGLSSSTGIEGSGEADAVTYACNTANSLQDRLAVRFAPLGVGGAQAGATVEFQAVAGDLDVNTSVTNVARIETSTETYTRTATTRFNTLSLETSTLTVSPRELEPGTTMTFTAVLRNTGLKTADQATLRGTLPAELDAAPDSITCDVGTCSISNGELFWRGTVTGAAPVRIEFSAELATPRPDGSEMPVVMELDDGHGTMLVVATSVVVRRSDLRASSFGMRPRFVEPGGISVLEFFVRNDGHRPTEARLEATIPPALVGAVGTPVCGTGACRMKEDTLIWEGALATRAVAQIRVPVRLPVDAAYGASYRVNAFVYDLRWDEEVIMTDQVMVAHNLFMPSIRSGAPEPAHTYLPLIQ